jgi:hypothetical protein
MWPKRLPVGGTMTQQEIVSILFDLMNGKPWSPKEGITITASQSMRFEVRSDGEKLLVTWSEPYVTVRGESMGFGLEGKLNGLIIERDRFKPIISGPIPDMWYKF